MSFFDYNGQMVPGLAKSMERSTNLIIICRYFHNNLVKNQRIILEQIENSQGKGSLYCPPSMKKTRVKRIMLAYIV
jgi:hypothetical protein